ncbi:hypothetical protein ACFV0T_23615 [Streptomyces sp. NPDC059582]|uniref:hypothetical protein n=1 Tax=Streptomyces sp. NPDC059582 TaxID=3346875 RepID=UPI00367997E2
MYEYELQRLRSAELIRHAERERLARAVVRDRRAARRAAAERATESESHIHRPRRHRLTRAA